MVAGRLTMVAPGVGEAAEGSGVARDCSGELRSGRACGGVGASRSAGGERVREGGEELRGVASHHARHTWGLMLGHTYAIQCH